MPSEPAFLSFSVSCFVSSFIGDKVIRNGAIIKEKELQHSGCPESASLKEKPAEAGVI
jgi:hypothetical protein